jgi:hypothetical protein
MNTTYPFAHMYTLHEGALVGTPLAGFRYVRQLPRALQATCNKQLEDDMVWRERVSAHNLDQARCALTALCPVP